MDVGILLIFQNYQGKFRDEEVVANERSVAELAEPLRVTKRWSWHGAFQMISGSVGH